MLRQHFAWPLTTAIAGQFNLMGHGPKTSGNEPANSIMVPSRTLRFVTERALVLIATAAFYGVLGFGVVAFALSCLEIWRDITWNESLVKNLFVSTFATVIMLAVGAAICLVVGLLMSYILMGLYFLLLFATVASLDLGVGTAKTAHRCFDISIDSLAALSGRKAERTAALLAFFLPPSIRADSFDTVFEELREDFAAYRKRYRERGARAWLAACFLARVVLLYLDCLRVWGLSKWLGPPTAKLWTRLLRGLLPLLIPYLWAAIALLR